MNARSEVGRCLKCGKPTINNLCWDCWGDPETTHETKAPESARPPFVPNWRYMATRHAGLLRELLGSAHKGRLPLVAEQTLASILGDLETALKDSEKENTQNS